MLALAALAQGKQTATRLPSARDHWAVSLPEHRVRTADRLQALQAGMPIVGAAPRRAQEIEPTGSLEMSGYGYLTGPDGTQWFYTQENTVGTSFYTSTLITLYDSSNQKAGEVNVEVDESMRVNAIQPYGTVTNHMFDRDESTNELLVLIHGVGDASNNYEGTYTTRAYHATGELMYELDGSGMLFSTTYGFTTYQRLLMSRYDSGMTYVDVYAPVAYGSSKPAVEHTFALPDSLINYCSGALVNCYNVKNKPYYVIAYYEKPFDDGVMDDGYYPIQREENNFIVEAYDKNYKLVDSIAAPINKPDDVTYRLADFGFWGDNDFSDGYFTADGEHAFIVTYSDLTTAYSDYIYSFVAYDSTGKAIKTICENAVEYQWFSLLPISGHDDQVAVLQAVGDVQQVAVLDMPSCVTALTIPASIDGDGITSTLNRYPSGDGYLYAIKMSSAGSDSEGNVVGRVNWYTPELTLDHTSEFNLGPNGEYFTPLLNTTTMNPYLFDTDDELEFVYIAKKKLDGSDAIQTVLEVADEDGSVIKTFAGDGNYVVINPSIFAATDTRNQMNIVYRNSDDYTFKVEFYDLPFSKFAKGGDGTAANPYLISTAGDMHQIKADPSACYKLTQNINMGKAIEAWKPVDDFTGTLDGDGYAVENLALSSDNYRLGLFQSANVNSAIRNITLVNPTVTVNENTGYAGVIAGDAMTCQMENVHVVGAKFSESGTPNAPVAGGLIGRATVYTTASGCSFTGEMNLPSSVGVGGIYGNSYTSSTATACYAGGAFTAAETLGGIVGASDSGSDITDCHASVTLAAQCGIGGIVGDNTGRASIKRCRAEGSISASGPSKTWKKLALGGIAGTMASDWNHSSQIIVSNNTVDMVIDTVGIFTPDGTAHRIAGMTIADEDYEPGEKHYTEIGMASNYATAATTVLGGNVSSDDDTSVEGASKDAAGMDNDFYTSLGYAYGTTAAEPWKGESGAPILYFEDEAKALILADNSLRVVPGSTAETTATVYGADADGMTCASADAAIATAEIVETAGNTATIRITGVAKGETTVSITAGGITTQCNVYVETGMSVASIATSGMKIRLNGNAIVAEGASCIAAYGINGQIIGRASGDTIATAMLPKGIYLVVATAADGHRQTAKIAIR